MRIGNNGPQGCLALGSLTNQAQQAHALGPVGKVRGRRRCVVVGGLETRGIVRRVTKESSSPLPVIFLLLQQNYRDHTKADLP